MSYKIIVVIPDGQSKMMNTDGVALMTFTAGGGGEVLVGGEITMPEMLKGTHQILDEYLRAEAIASMMAAAETPQIDIEPGNETVVSVFSEQPTPAPVPGPIIKSGKAAPATKKKPAAKRGK